MPRAGPTALDRAAGLGADWGPSGRAWRRGDSFKGIQGILPCTHDANSAFLFLPGSGQAQRRLPVEWCGLEDTLAFLSSLICSMGTGSLDKYSIFHSLVSLA